MRKSFDKLMTSFFKQTPPVMRRGLYWAILASCVAFFAAITVLIIRDYMHWPRTRVYRLLPVVLGFAPTLIITPIWRMRTKRIRQEAVDSDFRLCLHCAYNLSTLAGSGTCPECGHSYEIEHVRTTWQSGDITFPPPSQKRIPPQ